MQIEILPQFLNVIDRKAALRCAVGLLQRAAGLL